MPATDADPRLRRRVERLFALFLLYLAIAAAFVGANPFRGETTGPFDLLTAYPGWNPAGEEVKIRHAQRSDVLDWLLPTWMESRRQLHAGELPLWNPLQAAGRAALTDPTNALATVAFALFAAAPDPALGFYLSVLSTLTLAGLGMHLLVARYRSAWAALFAGISYMACGFITAWLFWPHAYTAMWIPWLLLAVSCFTATGSRRALAGIAAATAMLFLGGFPFVIALGLGAAIVHGVTGAFMRAEREARLRAVLGVGAGLVLGLALVAVPMLTLMVVIEAADLSHRGGGSSLSLANHARLLALPWAAAATPRVETNMYVGMSVLIFAATGIATMLRRRVDPLLLTGSMLTAVGVILTFGLLPREIGTHLPALSNNPWSRAILLLDFGLILLAASGVDLLLRMPKRRSALVAAGAALCLVHATDLGYQFRRFNGPTPARYFYSVGPELARLRDTAAPFQYTAQDGRQFMVSGTLGAIGVGEWFAHALRSRQLHNLLDALADDPFNTPTATAIGINAYHLSGELADAVGLCYAAYPGSEMLGRVIQRAKPTSRRTPSRAIAPINNIRVIQRLELRTAANVAAVAVLMANYRGKDIDGTVTLTLRPHGRRDGGSTVTIPAGSVKDNRMAPFRFPQPVRVVPGAYDLELLYRPGPKARKMTVWTFRGVPGHVMRGGERIPGSLTYTLLAADDGGLVPLAEGRSAVARNFGCSEGPYWTSDLTDPWRSARMQRARMLAYCPHDFRIQSTSPDAGFIVVPMQYQRGWNASVNGRPEQLRLVYGVLPALPVPAGNAEVVFRYRPPAWRAGLAVSTLAMLVLVWLVVSGRSRTRPRIQVV